MFKHLLTPLAAASLLCAGCSHLNPFSGDADENTVATASWNESSESESAWNQENSNPVASNTQAGNYETTPGFDLQSEQDGEGAVYDFASAEEASASIYGFSGDPAAELFSRVESLQASNTALANDLKQLNKQFSALVTSYNASATRGQATDRFIESASTQIDSFSASMASLDTQLNSIASEVTAARTEMREVKSAVTDVSNSTTANLTPVIENAASSTGTWFKIVLAAMAAGFAGVSFYCWKGFSSSRGDAAGR